MKRRRQILGFSFILELQNLIERIHNFAADDEMWISLLLNVYTNKEFKAYDIWKVFEMQRDLGFFNFVSFYGPESRSDLQ
jgi:hypothetical protein